MLKRNSRAVENTKNDVIFVEQRGTDKLPQQFINAF